MCFNNLKTKNRSHRTERITAEKDRGLFPIAKDWLSGGFNV